MSTHTKSWFSGFLVGSLLGAGIALLKAPRPGDETRAMLADKGMNMRDKAVSKVDSTVKQVEQATKDIVDEAGDRVDRLKSIGRTVYEEEAEIMQDGIKEAKKVIKTK